MIVVDLVSSRDSGFSKAISRPALVGTGRRSYGLSLYPWPILLFIGKRRAPYVLALGFGASFAAAWLTYALIEQLLLRMKRRMEQPSPGLGRCILVSVAGRATNLP